MQIDTLFDQLSLGNVHCPKCGHLYPVELSLKEKVEKELKSVYEQRLDDIAKRNEMKRQEWERERIKLTRAIENQEQDIEAVLAAQKKQIVWEIREETNKDVQDQLNHLQKELEKQKLENSRLKQQELTLAKKEAESEQQKEKLMFEMEHAFLQKRKEWENEIRQSFEQKQAFSRLEYEKKLTDQKKLLEEMQRKMEVGNSNMKGEIQEIAIEHYLRSVFAEDKINPVKSGRRGADCLQIVRGHLRAKCGSIYYESKRTKYFQHSWIEKLKSDMRECKADIGVLVTEAMPGDMERVGQKEGIWICNFEEFKGLSLALRDGLLRLHQVISAKESSMEKSQLIFEYLTSSEFRMQIEGILEGFSMLKQELEKEKRAMHAIWQRREKQLEKVLLNTNLMFNSIKGIAGGAIQDIQLLEFRSG